MEQSSISMETVPLQNIESPPMRRVDDLRQIANRSKLQMKHDKEKEEKCIFKNECDKL